MKSPSSLTGPRAFSLLMAVTVAVTLAALALPGLALGHAELVTSVPAEGSTIAGPFAGPITLTFSEALANYNAELMNGSGTLPATKGVNGKTMMLTPDTALPEGDYQVRWTSVADDGHIERGTIHFTIAATASPAPTPSPSPTPEPTATAASKAPGSASPTATSSAAPSASADASASPSVSPLPISSAGADTGNTSSGSDAILPIIAAMIIVVALAVFLLRRRDSTSSGS